MTKDNEIMVLKVILIEHGLDPDIEIPLAIEFLTKDAYGKSLDCGLLDYFKGTP